MQLLVVVVCFLCLAQAFTLRVRVGNGVIQRQHRLQQQLKIASPPLMLPLSGTSRAVVVAPPTIFSKAKSCMRTTISAFSTFLMQRPITASISPLCMFIYCGLKYPKPITKEKHFLNSTTTASDFKRTERRKFDRQQRWTVLLAVAVTAVSLLCGRARQLLVVEWRGISIGNKAGVLLKVGVVRGVLLLLGLVGGGLCFLWNERREEEAEEKYANSLLFAERAAVASMLKPFNLKVIAHELRKEAPPELWVERSEMLEQLEPLRLDTGKYVVILGEKGTGKSFVVYKFVLNTPGVVYLRLNLAIKAENVEQRLLKATGFNVERHPTVDPMAQLLDLLNMLGEELAPDVKPMVVVEIERNADPAIVDAVFRSFKKMSSACRSIVILSEVFAAMSMSSDEDRRMELWVPPFTDAETREYLGKANIWRCTQGKSAFSGAEIEDIITRLGGRPSTLHDLMKSSMTPARFLEERIALQKLKIYELLKNESRYAPVLRLLLQKGPLSRKEFIDMLASRSRISRGWQWRSITCCPTTLRVARRSSTRERQSRQRRCGRRKRQRVEDGVVGPPVGECAESRLARCKPLCA